MAHDLRIGIIGLDSSHTIEFTRRFQAPDCPPEQRVAGVTVTRCMRFETPFQDRAGLDGRQQELEGWGVEVTEDFDTAVAGADAVLIEINDPGLHLEYVRRCAGLGVPLFLDKPLACRTSPPDRRSPASRPSTTFASVRPRRSGSRPDSKTRAPLCRLHGT